MMDLIWMNGEARTHVWPTTDFRIYSFYNCIATVLFLINQVPVSPTTSFSASKILWNNKAPSYRRLCGAILVIVKMLSNWQGSQKASTLLK
jgi:hypothetical protein